MLVTLDTLDTHVADSLAFYPGTRVPVRSVATGPDSPGKILVPVSTGISKATLMTAKGLY